MNFDLTPDQQLLVKTAREFVKKESPIARLRRLREDPKDYDRSVWEKMGELGWLSVMFPEEVGGLGGSFIDAALILGELGTTLAPDPFIPSVVLAGSALAKAGSDAQREEWLAPMLEGSRVLALAYAEEASRYDVTRVETKAERRGEGLVVSGEKRFVLGGHAADAYVVSVRTSPASGARDGITLVLVRRDAPGVAVEPVRTMDGHHAATLKLSGVELTRGDVVGEIDCAGTLLDELVDLGAAAACAEASGILRTVLGMTVEYLKTREQFGVKIGTFQALQHRAVDMFIQTELQKSTAVMAMIKSSGADTPDRQRAISAAKVQMSVSGRFVTQQAIQLHGGIGVTDEHDVGLYFKRIHTLCALFGDEEHHLARFSALPSFTGGVR